MVISRTPTMYTMKKEILMLVDELQRNKKIIRDKLREIETLKLSKTQEIATMQKKLSEERSKYLTEKQLLELAKANAEAARWEAEAKAAKLEVAEAQARAAKAEGALNKDSTSDSCSIS